VTGRLQELIKRIVDHFLTDKSVISMETLEIKFPLDFAKKLSHIKQILIAIFQMTKISQQDSLCGGVKYDIRSKHTHYMI